MGVQCLHHLTDYDMFCYDMCDCRSNMFCWGRRNATILERFRNPKRPLDVEKAHPNEWLKTPIHDKGEPSLKMVAMPCTAGTPTVTFIKDYVLVWLKTIFSYSLKQHLRPERPLRPSVERNVTLRLRGCSWIMRPASSLAFAFSKHADFGRVSICW